MEVEEYTEKALNESNYRTLTKTVNMLKRESAVMSTCDNLGPVFGEDRHFELGTCAFNN